MPYYIGYYNILQLIFPGGNLAERIAYQEVPFDEQVCT